jgi:hypothetical protein
MGPVRVGGNIAAGSSFGTGRVFANGTLAGLTVGGSLLGVSPAPSSGSESGEVRCNGAMGPVTITGDVVGGRIGTTGRVFAGGPLASVTIGGSLIGGADRGTGEVFGEGPIGPVRIGGDIVGGFSLFSGPGGTGYVQGRRIASLFVGGSIRAGSEASGPDARSGSVRAAEDIGPITVRGSLLGDAETPVVISARGQAAPTGPADVAIRSVTVGGRVEHALILAGYGTNFVGGNGDAQIGAVVVGGDWVASRLAAGTGVGDDKTPGTPDDTFLGGGRPGVVSKIASIAIGGQALGTVGGADSFGLLAEKIGSLTVGGTVVPLTAGSDDRPVGATGDLRVVDAA